MAQKIRIHAENPRGLVEYIDELTGDFERHNQHSSGKGDDLRQELGIWNGKFGSYDRGDVRLYLRRTGLSKTGTYQWDLLGKLMADEVNFVASGYLARFLLCSIPDAPDRKLDLLSPHQETGLTELLRSLYRSLELLPERDYLLCDKAKVLFQGFNHVIVELDKEEPHFGMSLVYAKIESYAARLALWLHIVNAVVQDVVPGPVISGETMQAAIELASFYLWQHKLIHAQNSPSQKLEGILLKTQTCAEKLWTKGKALTASFAKSRINPLKSWVVGKIRERVFRVLAAGGFGRLEGEGENMVYIPNTVTPFTPCDNTFTIGDFGGIGGELVVPPTDGITLEQAIQTSVGVIGESLSTVDEVSCARADINTEETTKNTNLAVETPDLTELEPVGGTPIPSPTVGDDLSSWGSWGAGGAGGASSRSPEEVKSRGTEQPLVEQESLAPSENLFPSFSSSPASPALFNDDDPFPDDPPPDGGGGGVPQTPQPSNPNEDGGMAIAMPDGGEGGRTQTPQPSNPKSRGGMAIAMLTEEEVATWVDLMAGCQTLTDAIAFDQCLSALPLHHQTQIGDAAPDLMHQLWQLPEAAACHDTELLPNVVTEPDTERGDDTASLVLDSECHSATESHSQNPELNPTSFETSPLMRGAFPTTPEPKQVNSTAIKELVQLTIDGKAEVIQQILPIAEQLVVEPALSSEEVPLHDFMPGQRVISLSTQRKGVVSRIIELNVMVRFEDDPEFECPCNYELLRRLNQFNR
jgi:hypothetical protein